MDITAGKQRKICHENAKKSLKKRAKVKRGQEPKGSCPLFGVLLYHFGATPGTIP